MPTELELHPIQADILLVLLFNPRARFCQMNTGNIPTDQFSFHVKRLVKEGLINKTNSGLYQLTTIGKEFANRFDEKSIVLERQAKLGVFICCVKNENRITKYLIQQRLKEPYYGFYGFPTGKIKWGETAKEAATRELKEETGLSGDPQFIGINHFLDYSQDQELLEDKYFFIYRVNEPQGELIIEFDGGKNAWMTKKEILNLPHFFHGDAEIIEQINRSQNSFSETRYTVSKY